MVVEVPRRDALARFCLRPFPESLHGLFRGSLHWLCAELVIQRRRVFFRLFLWIVQRHCALPFAPTPGPLHRPSLRQSKGNFVLLVVTFGRSRFAVTSHGLAHLSWWIRQRRVGPLDEEDSVEGGLRDQVHL